MRKSFGLILLVMVLLPIGVFAQDDTPPPDEHNIHISEESAAFYDDLMASLSAVALPEFSCVGAPLLRLFQPAPDVEMPVDVSTERVETDGFIGAWFTPTAYDEQQVMLYVHGGGFMLGSVFGNYTPLISWIADQTAYHVLAVEYRLAPENPFPAGLENVQAAYAWLLEEGYDASQIVIAGDSAGGNLAHELLLGLRDAGADMPSAAWLYAPAVDFTQSSTTYQTLIDGDPTLSLLNSGERNWRYCYTDEDRFNDPAVSPIFADLSGLPPLFITVGTREALLGEVSSFARLARQSNVDVTLDIWDGMWHTWALDDPTLPESFQLYAGVSAWLDALYEEGN